MDHRSTGFEQPAVLSQKAQGPCNHPSDLTVLEGGVLHLGVWDLCFSEKARGILEQLILLKLEKTNSQNTLTQHYPRLVIFKTSLPDCSTYFYIYYF